MRALRFFVVGLVMVCIPGCFKPSIQGDWKGTKAIGPITSTVRYTFGADKRYSSENNVSSRLGSLRTIQSGTYDVGGDVITLHQKSATVNGAVIQRQEVITETHKYRLRGDTLILNMDQPDKVVLTKVTK